MSGFDEEECAAIAAAIKRHLHAKGISRKRLVRDDLSLSAINKALAGDFSDATLVKLETILERQFRPKEEELSDEAPSLLGGYTFRQVERLQGDYLCVRQLFATPDVLTAYIIEIRWDPKKPGLTFREHSRADQGYAQTGSIYIPENLPFFHLTTLSNGNVRNIVLNIPNEDGIARGLIVGFHRPSGATRIPVAAPIVLKLLAVGETPALGFINSVNPKYSEYQDLIVGVLSDGYGLILTGPSATDRRRGISLVETA